MTGDEVAAAVAVARDFGVSCTDPVVLADGSNVLVHLRPAPVVARVAKLTRLRPGVEAWLARDIAMAAFVSERGVAAVRPSVDPPAGPHARDGQVLAFFEYMSHFRDISPSPDAVVRVLASLHAVLDDYDGELPLAGPVDDLRIVFDLVEGLLPGSVLARLRADLEMLARRIREFPVRALHGDAHPGNLLWTPNGLVWNDFEDAWRGPLGWDLACLATSGYSVAAYPGLPPEAELDVCIQLRTLFGVGWRYLLDDRFPGRAPDKAEHLSRWLSRG